MSGSFYILQPNASSCDYFEVGAFAARALDISVSHFRYKVYCFFRSFGELLPAKCPGVTAVPAFQLRPSASDSKSSVPKTGWLELLKSKDKNLSFDLLEFADLHVDLRDLLEFLFFGDFRSRF